MCIRDSCSDATLIDLEAFNAINEGFVKAKQPDLVKTRIESALRSKSAIELEDQLNTIGVPAAKVRTLSEFLEELSKGNHVNIPFASYEQDDKVIKTTGLGFSLDKASQSTKERSPNLGEHTYEILKDIGIDDNQIAKIIEANILK